MAREEKTSGEAVGVVFSPGGRVYSFDPAGLEIAWNERMQLDYSYVRHWTFQRDLAILARTAGVVLSRRGSV